MRVVLGQRKTGNFEKNRDQNEGKIGIHGTESDKKRRKNPEPGKKIPAFALLSDIYKL